jgi:phytoene/squalene synthetase
MTAPTALDSFIDKWRTRWPEWAVAEVFVQEGDRARALAWFALLQEFDDILNVAGDPLPADAKLGWWATELRDWAGHRSRHPLGRLLEPLPAPWARLADSLPALIAGRTRPADMPGAFAALASYAAAVAEVEAAVLGASRLAAEVVAAQVLATRLAEAGLEAVPQSRQPVAEGAAEREQAQRSWARDLLAAWPSRAAGSGPRRLWSSLARRRLEQIAAGRSVGAGGHPLRLLWRSWRAARG